MTLGHDFLGSNKDLRLATGVHEFSRRHSEVQSSTKAASRQPSAFATLLTQGCIPRIRLTHGPAAIASATEGCRKTCGAAILRSTVSARAYLPAFGLGGIWRYREIVDDDSAEEASGSQSSSPVRALVRCGMGHAVMARGLLSRAITAAAGAEGQELRTSALGFLASILTPIATGGAAAATSGVAVAFCPIPFDCLGNLGIEGLKTVGLEKYAKMPEFSCQDLERGVLVATFLQGSLGLLRICLGDVFSGSYTLLLATLGYNARKPGPASNWLKTYVLITFINGTMGGIDVIQHMLLNDFPVVAIGLPLSVNLMHAVQLSVPGVSFLGAYCGWQHIKAQRKIQMEVYQEQLLAMMQQTPWPPPQPPPFMIPGMPGMPGGPMLENGAGGVPFHMPGAPVPQSAPSTRGPAASQTSRQRLAPVKEEETEEAAIAG